MTSTDKWIMKEPTARRRGSSSPALVLAWIFVVAILILSFVRFWAF
jgi:hypothetical protein